jgi:hypothetical protein
MRDGRLTIYFGQEERTGLEDTFKVKVGKGKSFRSEAEFVRHCIRFTLENDKELKKRRVK